MPELGLAVRVVAEREQRRDVAARLQPHVAAPAAVAAVGTATRHVRLAPERDTARAAVATLHVALRDIDEARTPAQDTDRAPSRPSDSPYDRVDAPARWSRSRRSRRPSLLAACSSSEHATPPTTSAATAGDHDDHEHRRHDLDQHAGRPDTATATAHDHGAPELRIVSFTGPPSPVPCNAPDAACELALGDAARDVGDAAASTAARCSRPTRTARTTSSCRSRATDQPQTYVLTAHGANGVTVSKTLTIEPRMLATS